MNTVPKWFLPVAILALAWNLLGCAAIAVDLMLTPDQVAAMTPEQQALYAARPGWAVIGSVLAVGAGVFGSLGLVLRRRWAVPLLVLSLLGVIVQDAGFLVARGTAPLPTDALIMQSFVAVVAVALAMLGRHAARHLWLR
jgi:hypothetical protein